MECLIKEALVHVADIGPFVADGKYDLLGPHNAIIMPATWNDVIKPGWEVTMLMWPIPEPLPKETITDGIAEAAAVDEGTPPPSTCAPADADLV